MTKVQELLSKLAGMAKMAKAALSGDAGILNTLAGEHAEVALLMTAVVEDCASENDTACLEARRELYGRVRAALVSHAQAEEAELYAVLQAHLPTRDRAAHSVLEHREIEHLLRRLDGLPVADLHWLPVFTTLQMRVEAHVTQEETVLFEEAKRVLDNRTLREIDDRYQATKKRIEAGLQVGRAPGATQTPLPL